MTSRSNHTGNAKSRVSGFTLIEILIAVAILAFGILSVASMQGTSLLKTKHAANITDAMNEAARLIEEIQKLDYDAPELQASPTDSPRTVGPYNVAWTVTPNATPDGSTLQNVKTVEVAVTWTEAGGAQKQAQLTYMVVDII